MTITRLWQSGAESGNAEEYETVPITLGASSLANANSYSGHHSWLMAQSHQMIGSTFTSTTSIRMGAMIRHSGTFGTTSYPRLFTWVTPAGSDNYVEWDAATDLLRLYINGSLEDSVGVSTAGFDTTDKWYHIGLTLNCNATTGWVTFYLNRTSTLSFSGNTSTGVTEAYIGGTATANKGWANSMYVDDLYIDDIVGESDSAPPLIRFIAHTPNGNGSTNSWIGSDGNSTNNYQLVDDAIGNGLVAKNTYVEASSNIKDDYSVEDSQNYNNYTFNAVILYSYAFKDTSAIATTLSLYSYDGTTYQSGSSNSLSTDYDLIQERQSLQPDGTAWNDTDFNSMKFGQEATGDFS